MPHRKMAVFGAFLGGEVFAGGLWNAGCGWVCSGGMDSGRLVGARNCDREMDGGCGVVVMGGEGRGDKRVLCSPLLGVVFFCIITAFISTIITSQLLSTGPSVSTESHLESC